MPIQYEIRDDTIWFTTTGDVAYDDGLATLRAGIAEARARDGARRWHVIFDIRQSSEDRIADEPRGIAELVACQLATLSGRCAIVAGDPLHFGLARMFGAYSERHEVSVEVMSDPGEAVAWLDSQSH